MIGTPFIRVDVFGTEPKAEPAVAAKPALSSARSSFDLCIKSQNNNIQYKRLLKVEPIVKKKKQQLFLYLKIKTKT